VPLQGTVGGSIPPRSTKFMKENMIVKPLHKKVLVAENKSEVTSESGIILDGANSVRESKKATVLAIGPNVTDVKVGDVVLIEWAKATPVKVGDAQRAMIDQEHIVAVFD
jgi:co-chaperonin GroES (HSP10)